MQVYVVTYYGNSTKIEVARDLQSAFILAIQFASEVTMRVSLKGWTLTRDSTDDEFVHGEFSFVKIIGTQCHVIKIVPHEVQSLQTENIDTHALIEFCRHAGDGKTEIK